MPRRPNIILGDLAKSEPLELRRPRHPRQLASTRFRQHDRGPKRTPRVDEFFALDGEERFELLREFCTDPDHDLRQSLVHHLRIRSAHE